MSQNPDEAKTPFVTFYSFKGGVGRSMALINVAGILAGRGFRVLAIDVDLEAPGISYLTEQSPAGTQLGFIDVLANIVERGGEADLVTLTAMEVVEKYSFRMEVPQELSPSKEGVLRVMPAGRIDDGYSARLEKLGLGKLYTDGYGKPMVQALKIIIQKSACFDVVLVDSRTGFSEEAGVCTRDLADHVVVVMGLNKQNVRGTAEFLGALRRATKGEETKGLRVVLSPVPNGEDELVDKREAAAKVALEKSWGAEIPLGLQIPYHPRLALTEEPHIFRRSRGYLYDAYVALERAVNQLIGFDERSIVRQVEVAARASDVDRVARGIEQMRKLDLDPTGLVLSESVQRLLLAKPNTKLRACIARALPSGSYATQHIGIKLWDEKIDDAGLFFAKLVKEQPDHAVHLGNYALFLQDVRGEHEGAEELYKRALESDPKNATNLGSYANFLWKVRGENEGAEELYKRALESDPKPATNLGNYAVFLTDVRGEHEGVEELYKRALESDPKNANVLGNYANFLWKVRGEHEGAEELYKRALESDPKDANVLGNYAQLLFTRNRDDEATACVEHALNTPSPASELLCELHFYACAHARERYPSCLAELAVLLTDGKRSPGWSLNENVRVVRESEDRHADFIAALADVVSDKAGIETLSPFPEWQRKKF